MSPSDVTMQLKPTLPHEFCSRIGSVESVSFGASRSRICRYASARTAADSKPPAWHESPPAANRSTCTGCAASFGANSCQSGDSSSATALAFASIPRKVKKTCRIRDTSPAGSARPSIRDASSPPVSACPVIRTLAVPLVVLSEQLGPFPETVPILPPGLETTSTHALSHRIKPRERSTMLKSAMPKNNFCDAVFPLEEIYAVFPLAELYARPMHQSSMQE